MINKSHRNYLFDSLLIFFGAFLLRLLYGLFLKENYFFYEYPSGDVDYYRHWAGEIASGHWVESASFRGLPLYPHFLSILMRLTFNNTELIRTFHLMLGALNCVFIYLIGRRVFSREVGVLSGILMSVSFTGIHYDWLMIPVPLLIFLNLVIVLFLLQSDQKDSWSEWFIFGLLIGAAILGDGKILIFVVLIALSKMESLKVRRHIIKFLISAVVGIILVIGANGIRNKIFTGDWVWVSSQSGLSFYVGNNPRATGFFENPDFIRPTHEGQDADQTIVAQIMTNRKLKPSQVSNFWSDQALAFIIGHPLEYIRLLGNKMILFLRETESSYDLDLLLQRDWKGKMDINPFVMMTPLALLGMVLSRRIKGAGDVNLLILSQLMMVLIFFMTHRHRAVILPFLLIYEAYMILELIRQFQLRNFKFIVSMFFFVFVWSFILSLAGSSSMAREEVDFYRLTKTAFVYEEKKDFQNAQICYQQALNLHPRDTNAMYNLANVFAKTGNFDLASTYYEKILAFNPFQIDTLYNLGFVQAKEGDYVNSMATFQRLLSLEPDSPDTLFQVGLVFQKLRKCEDSRAYFNKLLKLYPFLEKQVNAVLTDCF